MKVLLQKSPRSERKWRVTFPDGRHVDFGATGYSDYTIHHNFQRMQRYVRRHRDKENWSYAGRYTPGFWSRWLLWSVPSMDGAKRLIKDKFNLAL